MLLGVALVRNVRSVCLMYGYGTYIVLGITRTVGTAIRHTYVHTHF